MNQRQRPQRLDGQVGDEPCWNQRVQPHDSILTLKNLEILANNAKKSLDFSDQLQTLYLCRALGAALWRLTQERQVERKVKNGN